MEVDDDQYYDNRYNDNRYDDNEYYNEDQDSPDYDEEENVYGQPIIFISAHGSVVVDSHPDFNNLSAPQLNVYKHTPVFWLTTFGTVLRNHNYDTSPNRMMNDSIDFIYNTVITIIESVEN